MAEGEKVQVYRIERRPTSSVAMCGLAKGGLVAVVVERVEADEQALADISPLQPASGTLYGMLEWERREFHADLLRLTL